MDKKERVAVFGGTFNPPHMGHVRAAEALSREIAPDKFLVVPSFIPPHKSVYESVTPEDRLNMSRLAFSHIERVEISDIEIRRGGTSYTALTLEELSKDGRELYFLCGTDMFLTMSSWFMPEKIFSLATICYVRREDDKETEILLEQKKREYEQKFAARIIEIKCRPLVVSSTEMRAASDNLNNEAFLSKAVCEYIKTRGLY